LFSSSVATGNKSTTEQSNSMKFTKLWQQFWEIQYKNIVHWKRRWIILLLVQVMITVALCVIFHLDLNKSEAQLATTKVTMDKLMDPQVLFVAGTSRDSQEMKHLIDLFSEKVKQANGTFIEEEQNMDLNQSDIDGVKLSPKFTIYSICSTFEHSTDRQVPIL
jgi:ABC-type uncharacterized transport system fused permease/ATPase subunit